MQSIACGNTSTQIANRCDYTGTLMGYYTFENTTADLSLAKWAGTFYNSFQANMYGFDPVDVRGERGCFVGVKPESASPFHSLAVHDGCAL